LILVTILVLAYVVVKSQIVVVKKIVPAEKVVMMIVNAMTKNHPVIQRMFKRLIY
jgi:hypothetical protein